ncbi:MAG: hypothetical protein LBH12_04945 [Dysgonamonadaceae bacterium]|jgi:hypothetical protein|nr:hypothetical protein [Dysgonamonadaceae bacterium]
MKAQADSSAIERLKQFVRNIQQFHSYYPQEKVYLHFDNTGYFLGETIWFKAYVVTAEHHRMTDLSKVLYVELLNGRGDIQETKKLKIENGQSAGEFILKNDNPPGYYEVRAYTRYMLNQGDDYLFSRVIPIFAPPSVYGDYSEREIGSKAEKETRERVSESPKKEVNLVFYPEGGSLVSGLRSRVAFKATDKQGRNLPVKGDIRNSRNEPLAEFSTLHHGMGVFEITPDSAPVHATVHHEGRSYDFPVPPALSEGYVLSADIVSENKLSITVRKSPTLPSDSSGIMISCRGKIYYFNVFQSRDPYRLDVPLSVLPCGVNGITLFNSEGIVLSERPVFVYHSPEAVLSVRSDKDIYQPFEKINIEIETKNAQGFPINGELSLSVRDASNSFEEYYPDHLYVNLLLSSELKGHIKYPSYYFQPYNSEKQSHLDLLMLVHGWSRYSRKAVPEITSYRLQHPLEDGLLINGTVSDSRKKPMPDTQINLWLNDKSSSLHGSNTTNDDGTFAFLLDSTDIYDRWTMVLRTSSVGETKKSRILLDRLFTPSAGSYFPEATDMAGRFYFTPALTEEPAKTPSLKEEQVLNPVIVKAGGNKSPKGPDIVYETEKDVELWQDRGENYPLTVGDYLIKKGCSYDQQTRLYNGKEVRLCYRYENEEAIKRVRLKYEGKIENIHIKEVYRIEIYFSDPYAWTKIPFGDCSQSDPRPMVFISVYLYDDGIHEHLPEGVRHTYFHGYTLTKEFSSPDYEKIPPIPGEMDYRRTLYWNPNIRTGTDGKARVTFFNNGSRSKPLIDCEGITGEGTVTNRDDQGGDKREIRKK